MKARGLPFKTLLTTMAFAFSYDYPADQESARLQEMLKTQPLETVIKTVTGLEDEELVAEIAKAYRGLGR
jgi:mannitol-1-phosphate 5-dehydrogenase